LQLDITNNGVQPSEVASRYLETIYYIDAEGEAVRSARLADWLGVTRPTVAAALRRMERDGLVSLGARKEIALTDRGRMLAEAIVRRHRIMERWLTDQLGLDWVAADEEAARLEHAVSDRVEQRIYEALGRPTSCPHGNPIPGYAVMDPAEIRLSVLEPGEAVLTRVSEVAEREAPALLGYLHERGLLPGVALRVIEADRVGGMLRLEVGGREVALSQETASRVLVLPRRR
jgi:DtxR family Mn-dependent transcriptional regulator